MKMMYNFKEAMRNGGSIFDSIPEVPCHGALIKVCYAGASFKSVIKSSGSVKLRNSKSSNGISSRNISNSFIRTSTSFQNLPSESHFSNQNDSDENRLQVLKSPITVIRDKRIDDPGVNRRMVPGIEISGRIEMLGEEIDEEDSPFQIGDPVIILPNISTDLFTDYVEFISVSSLSDLVRIPAEIPLCAAALIPTAARSVHRILSEFRSHLQHLKGQSETKKKVLLIGCDQYLIWALQILESFKAENEIEIEAILAVNDESAFWHRRRTDEKLKLVQWEEQVYGTILIERTMEVCGGQVDIVIDLKAPQSFFRRSLECLKDDGMAFVVADNQQSQCKKFFFSRRTAGTWALVEPGDRDDYIGLMDCIAKSEVKTPEYEIYGRGEVRQAYNALLSNKFSRTVFQIAKDP